MITNKDRVLDYMKQFGSITTLDAFRDLGNTRLSASIFLLKQDGHVISSKQEGAVNRFGKPVTYSRYYLVKENGEC